MILRLLSGNEAIAYGARESGISVMAGYPGLPSTEIIETAEKFKEIYCEWSENENVAMDVGIGASLSGARVLLSMKDLGLNVAADPFFGVSGAKINGALIIVVCDDVGRLLGDDMNDARHYAYMAGIPLIEPSTAQEAKDYVAIACRISEKYHTPILFRMTAILTHSIEPVWIDESASIAPVYSNPLKYKYTAKTIMSTVASFPNNSELRKRTENLYVDWTKRLEGIDEERMRLDQMEYKDLAMGFIGGGVAILHAREAYPNASYLKLGMTYPLNKQSIVEFCQKVDNVYIIEEPHSLLEESIRAMGIEVHGADVFKRENRPFTFTPMSIKEGIEGIDLTPITHSIGFPMQLPVMCPGCPHMFLFTALKEMGVRVAGDSGCYALSLFPPYYSMDLFMCMGASVGMAHGASLSGAKDVVAVMGDGVFYHSGINGIMNELYNNGTSTIIIADNDCIAMTGGQLTLAHGGSTENKDKREIPIEDICEAIGVEKIRIVDPYDMETLKEYVNLSMNEEGVSIVISRHPCLKKKAIENNNKMVVNKEKCIACYKCTKVGCFAIGRDNNMVNINKSLCVGCGLCKTVCPTNALSIHEDGGE